MLSIAISVNCSGHVNAWSGGTDCRPSFPTLRTACELFSLINAAVTQTLGQLSSILSKGIIMRAQPPEPRPQTPSTAKDHVVVTKVKYGYLKLTDEEAASGQFGPVGLKIAKDSNCTAILHGVRQQLLQKHSLNEAAASLNERNVPVDPYATNKFWTGPLLEGLMRSPLLQGLLETGTKRSYHPELAHFTQAEQGELWRELDSRNRRRPAEQPHRRLGVSRSDTLWPGRGILCSICDEPLWWVSATQLKCRNTRPGSRCSCWNQVLVSAPLLRQNLFPQLVALLGHHPQILSDLVDAAWTEYPGTSHQAHRQLQIVEEQIADLKQQESRLVEAIAKMPDSAALLEQLGRTESELRRLNELRSTAQLKLAEPVGISREDIAASLVDVLTELSTTSYVFGDLLRAMFPDLVVYPVQALDSPQVRPRVIFRIPTTATTSATPGDLVINAFEPPDYIKHATACARFQAENPYLGTCHVIGEHLGLHKLTVSRALRYAEVMRQHQTNDPYVVLTQPPAKASRWRKQSLQPPDAA